MTATALFTNSPLQLTRSTPSRVMVLLKIFRKAKLLFQIVKAFNHLLCRLKACATFKRILTLCRNGNFTESSSFRWTSCSTFYTCSQSTTRSTSSEFRSQLWLNTKALGAWQSAWFPFSLSKVLLWASITATTNQLNKNLRILSKMSAKH